MLSLETTSGRAGEADAIGGGIHARIRGCHGDLSKGASDQAEKEGKCFHGREGKGGRIPPIVSPDQCSDQAVTLADRSREDAPLIAALALHGGGEDACRLHINHHRVDGALVALRVQSHASDDLRAGLFAVLNQGGADGVAGDQVEVHRWCGGTEITIQASI